MHISTTTIEQRAAGLTLRAGTSDDAEACGRIFYDAFASIANRHNLPVEPGSPEFARFKAGDLFASEGITGLVAERDGEIVGSAFADERGSIVGIGPVTVSPGTQDMGVGRAMMEALVQRQRDRGAAGIRLVQTAYHYRSLALYAKLGFAVREPLSVVQGTPPALSGLDASVRAARDSDLGAGDQLCARIHGHDRSGELRDAIAAGTARVVERDGQLRGYATGFGYGWHAVADTNADLIALLARAETFVGLGILIPSRNTQLLRWCLDHDLKIVQQSTLMTIGLYNEPAGAWLPSIVY